MLVDKVVDRYILLYTIKRAYLFKFEQHLNEAIWQRLH